MTINVGTKCITFHIVTVLHGDPGTRRRGLEQTGVLMDEERRRYRNTGKDINISVDIDNNQQETRGRTDY